MAVHDLTLRLGELPPRLWREAATARHRLLMLDYDGTLAPFHPDRRRALPHPRALAALGQIVARKTTAVAIVSGRPLAEIGSLLGPLPVTMVGEHGWEERHPPHGLVQRPLPAGAEAALARAAEQAVALGLGPRLEPKRSAIMFHTRSMPRAEAEASERALSARWQLLAQDSGLRLLRADGGIELACTERTKGTAVHDLIAAADPGVYAVYVGDDSTDEDAFRAILGTGIGILVAEQPRASLAAARLPSIEAVADFLETWFHVVDTPGSTAP